MKITYLELKNYTRLQLNNIKHIVYQPESKIQLILGTNGSGKSSLMKELTPLPAIPSEYEKEGYKLIHITHKGSNYILKSDFTSGAVYSFIKDDEELNPGYTVTTYKQLVKKEFNVTNETHELLIDNRGFHSMSSQERRNWFTRLSSCDYTFALQYFQRLKDSLRDSQAIVKNLQSRLITEQAKLINKEEEELIREEIRQLKLLLDTLIDNKPYVDTDLPTLQNKLSQVESLLKNNLSYLENLSIDLSVLQDVKIHDINSLDRYIEKLTQSLTELEIRVKLICENIEHDEKLIERYKVSNITNTKDIDINIKELDNELYKLYQRYSFNFVFYDNKQALAATESISDMLTETFLNIPINDYNRFNRERYTAVLEESNNIKTKIEKIHNELSKCLQRQKDLLHFKNHDVLTCPNCQHKWNKNYSEIEYQNNENLIEKLNQNLVIEKDKLKALESYIEEAKEYGSYLRNYGDIAKRWGIIKPIFDYIDINKYLYEEPRKLPNILNNIKSEIKLYLQADEIKEKLDKLSKLKETLKNTSDSDIISVNERVAKANKDLFDLNSQISAKKRFISILRTIRNNYHTSVDKAASLKDMLSKRDLIFKDMLAVYKRDYFNNLIKSTQIEISNKEQQLSTINTQKVLVESLNTQILEQMDNVEILKIAVKKLSPSEGLIAKGLTGFINHFVLEMNNFIKKVWLYPLELVKIESDENNGVDLDYKFMVRVNGVKTIPDISKASSAMKEIIDLSFKIVCMRYLGLNESPIYLDEFASSFDKDHRQSAYNAINSLLVNSNYSQIFMISHYEDCYGSFKNTDITVLCPNNIPLPKDSAFNQVITMF